MLKRRESILFIILAIGIYCLILLQLKETFFLYGIAQIILYFIFILVLFYAVYRGIKDKKQVTLLKKIQPLILGVLIGISFLFMEYWIATDGGKNIVLSAGNNDDLAYIQLDLRSDNTFKLINSGPMGGSIYRGKYHLQNDTLRIENNDLKYLYPTLTFAIKQDDSNKKYFEPTDSSKYKYNLYFQPKSRN